MSTPSDKTLRLERTKLTPQAPKGRNTQLIMAIVAGLTAAVLAYIWIRQQQQTVVKPTPVVQAVQAPQPVVPTVETIQAAKDIPARTIITSDMITYYSVPQPKMPQNAVVNMKEVVGMAAITPIKSGQTIIHDMLGPNIYPLLGITALIKQGYRAMTITLNPETSISGFLKPGDHVDVLGTFDLGRGKTITRTVLQDVPLLATGSQVEQTTPVQAEDNSGALGTSTSDNSTNPDNGDNPVTAKPQDVPNATLLIRPIDAEKLVMAEIKGKLAITLRGDVDRGPEDIPMIDSSVVTTAPPVPAPPAPVVVPAAPMIPSYPVAPPLPATNSIVVIRGTNSSTTTVPGN